jgi:hypothetical protein
MDDVHMPSLDSVEAGAPGSCYGDLYAEPPYPAVAGVDLLREALDRIFYDWWADNDHALSLGLPGDVLELRERLNAAFAKSTSCSLEAPREVRNAPIAISKSVT